MWRFTRNHQWIEVDCFLTAKGWKPLENELEGHGYSSSSSFTVGEEQKFCAKVFYKSENVSPVDAETGEPVEAVKQSPVEDKYLAVVGIGRRLHKIVLPDFPDLLEFLSKIGAICSALKNNSPKPSPIESEE